MTALCTGNGPSQAKPGASKIQTFLAGGISDLLYTNEVGWFAALAAGVGILQFDLDTFCATDPPALPNVDAARIAQYFNPTNPVGAAQLAADAEAMVGHYLWFTTCQCTTGAQPPPPAPVPQPTGYQTNNPQTTIAPVGTGCQQQTIFETKNFDATGNLTWDIPSFQPLPVAGQWISLAYSAGASSAGTAVYPVTHTFTFKSQTGAVLGNQSWQQTADILFANQEVHQFVIPPGSATWTVTSSTALTSAPSFGMDMPVTVECSAPPVQLQEPCCPPDPTLENLISQVLRLEQLILNSLGGSNAYTRGTAHPGLSGSGSLSVASLRGIAADVTTGTPTTPLLPGNPPYQWNLGWLSMSDGGGMLQELRLTRQHQIWLPNAANLALTVGYSFDPGVVVTLTELQPA